MNDTLAVSLFPMENCLKLLFTGQFAGVYYLLPFAMWFGSLYDPEIPLLCREQVTEFSFRWFCEWLQRAPQDIRGGQILRISNFLSNLSQSCLI
jgi:hypothetical protein